MASGMTFRRFLSFCISLLLLVVALYQMHGSITKYLSKPTSSSIGKAPIYRALPLYWVCHNPGVNITRLEEFGYSSIEDLREGKRIGTEDRLDWPTDMAEMYTEITTFEGGNLIESNIVSEDSVYRAFKVNPEYNFDFGSCVEIKATGRPRGRRPNVLPSIELNFENLKGAYTLYVTDIQRRKYKPNLLTSKTPPIHYVPNANRNYNVHITKTVLQADDPKSDCKEYGEETFSNCYSQEQEAFFMGKLSCVPPQFSRNASTMCRGKLDPGLFDTELANYFYDLSLGGEPTNCSTPCTTLDVSTTFTGETPSSNSSAGLLRLILPQEVTRMEVNFRWDLCLCFHQLNPISPA